MFKKIILVLQNGTMIPYLCINKQKIQAMNKENTIASLSKMFTSESSFNVLVDMMNDMDLELMEISF